MRSTRSSVGPLATKPSLRANRAPARPPSDIVIALSASLDRRLRREYLSTVPGSFSVKMRRERLLLIAEELASLKQDLDRNALPGKVCDPASVSAVHPGRAASTTRAHRKRLAGTQFDFDRAGLLTKTNQLYFRLVRDEVCAVHG